MNVNKAVLNNGLTQGGGVIALGLTLGALLTMPATTLAADTYTNGTWKVRADVGTSVANPALWMDEANWVDGKIPDGPELALADFRVGTSTDVIWVKLPDDRPIMVQKLFFVKGGARIRFFGGQGFRFTRTTGATYIQLVKEKTTQEVQAYLGVNPGEAAPIFFTPIHCEVGSVEVNNIAIAGPLSFGFSNKVQMDVHWWTAFRADRFAESGGEERQLWPNLTRLKGGELGVDVPVNNDEHTGSWVATKDSKIFRYASGKTGTELAVGQYVHADGVIPEGTYVEYIYDDNYIGLSQAALADSADATAGTSITFDRCYYKLSQTFEKWTVDHEAAAINSMRRTAENECTVTVKSMTLNNASLQRFWLNSAERSATPGFPASGIVELWNASGLESKELRFAGSSYLRLSGESLAANTVSKLRFDPTTAWGTIDVPDEREATVGLTTMNADWRCQLIKEGAGKLTLASSGNNAKALGTFKVQDGALVLAPKQDTSVVKMTVEDGAELAIAGTSKVTITTVDILSGGTFVWPTNATLSVKNFNVTVGSSIRFEMAVKDDGSVDPYSITDNKYNLANGGEIRLTGDVKRIAHGRHRLVTSNTIGDASGWTLTGYKGRGTLELVKDEEGLYLKVVKPGMIIMVE